MARPLDAALNYTSCQTLLWILGAVTAISAIMTGLTAGQGGSWGWWLLLALLFGALWIYTWFYCGREAVTGESELAKPARTGPPAAATATKAAKEDGGAASTAKSAHWARPAGEAGARSGTNRTTVDRQSGTPSSPESGKKSALSSAGGSGASKVSSGSDTPTERAGVTGSTGTTRPKPDSDSDGDKEPASGKSESPKSAVEQTSSGEKTADRSSGTSPATPGGTSGDDGRGISDAGSSDASPDSKPDVLAAARDGKADDLKKISGVGPKLEGLLHSLGFFHFDQIAAWTSANVAWVDDHLGFKGRIDRDDWVNQAKTLAAGGTTEFAERVARGDVESSKKS